MFDNKRSIFWVLCLHVSLSNGINSTLYFNGDLPHVTIHWRSFDARPVCTQFISIWPFEPSSRVHTHCVYGIYNMSSSISNCMDERPLFDIYRFFELLLGQVFECCRKTPVTRCHPQWNVIITKICVTYWTYTIRFFLFPWRRSIKCHSQSTRKKSVMVLLLLLLLIVVAGVHLFIFEIQRLHLLLVKQ